MILNLRDKKIWHIKSKLVLDTPLTSKPVAGIKNIDESNLKEYKVKNIGKRYVQLDHI